MNKKLITKVVLTGITALSLATVSTSAFSAKPKLEKCSGIVKKGMADGTTEINGKMVEWIYVPAGACEKLVDGIILFDPK